MRKHLLIYEGFPKVAQSVNSRRWGDRREELPAGKRALVVRGVQEFRSSGVAGGKNRNRSPGPSFSETAVFSESQVTGVGRNQSEHARRF
jgi:hypothetical protein